MEYNWSIEQIEEHKKQVKYLLKHTKGLTKEKKRELKETILGLIELEKQMSMDEVYYSFQPKIKYADPSKFLPIYTLQEYTRVPINIKDYIFNSIPYFKNFVDNYHLLEVPMINLTNQELVSMSHDFYKWLPNKNYEKDFRNFTNPENHLLRFVSNPTVDILGLTQPFYYPTYQPYFSISRNNTIDDFETLNHEIAHGIFFKEDNLQSINGYHYYLMELEGSFFDYLTGRFLMGIMDDSIIKQLDYYKFINNYEYICELYLIQLVIRLYLKKKAIDISEIEKIVLKDELSIPINENILSTTLYENVYVYFQYSLSYFTSLDLETIAEYDLEYAFYLFEKIRRNKTDDIFSNLRENGITFMDDGYQNLQKKIKTFGEIQS